MRDLMVRTHTFTMLIARLIVIVVFAVLLSAVPFHAALAATGPNLGTAGSFAVLGGPAVTLTNSIVYGDVGVDLGGAVTLTGSTIGGTVHEGGAVAGRAYDDFLAAYNKLAGKQCDYILSGNLKGVTLYQPGVYCVEAASTTTDGTLTLNGPANGIWIFKIGTGGTGALTGTNFSVVMEGGGQPCDVYWWVAEGAIMTMTTDSAFQGTILAGAGITVTGGTFNGDALAQAAVTMTGATIAITGCERTSHPARTHCTQGVGNAPENCDPGNSNNHNPSNDERGGTPGDPGRKVGNR